jgi:hypothetical protein
MTIVRETASTRRRHGRCPLGTTTPRITGPTPSYHPRPVTPARAAAGESQYAHVCGLPSRRVNICGWIRASQGASRAGRHQRARRCVLHGVARRPRPRLRLLRRRRAVGPRWITMTPPASRWRYHGRRYPYYLLKDSPEGAEGGRGHADGARHRSRLAAASGTASSTSACRTSR